MQRRRRVSLQEQLFNRDKVLADIRECEDESNTPLGTVQEEDIDKNTKKSSNDDTGSEEQGVPFLHKVVAEGNVELLSKLIDSGTDVNVCDDDGWPPLNTAIRLGQTECAALLLKHGAGDFFFQKQKEEYLQRLHVSKRRRRKSHWI